MNEYFLTGELYIDMLMTGAEILREHKEEVNNINVFPIADNDTGENMRLTLFSGLSGVVGVESEDVSLGAIAKKISDIMIYGAQGNSGIILAKIFQGISDGFAACDKADVETLKKVFVKSAEGAYEAVPDPVEGTMLSVFKNACITSSGNVQADSGLLDYFEYLNGELKEELRKTPDLLKILKDNNVVDSGALGLCYIFDGFAEAVKGNIRKVSKEDIENAGIHSSDDIGVSADKPDKDFENNLKSLEPGFYCTNFLVKLNDKSRFSGLKKMLNENGSSIVCFMAGDSAKGHVHTDNPEGILSKISDFGEIVNYKVDAMEDEKSYTLFVDTNMDMTPELCEAYGMKLIKYPYTIDGKIYYPYIDWKEFDYKSFYQKMRDGVPMTTFSLTKEQYIEYFEPEFMRGKDILYLHQSEATTKTFQFMRQAAAELKEKYPNRRFAEINSKAFTVSGMLIALEAGDMYAAGMSIDEIAAWADSELDNVATYTTAKDLSFFVRSGRMSKMSGMFGNIIGMHPIVHGSKQGFMEFLGMSFGRKRTYREMISYALEDGIDVEQHRIIVGHSDLLKEAKRFRKEIEKVFPNAEIITGCINPTIGIHCGPDNVCFAVHAKRRESPQKDQGKK